MATTYYQHGQTIESRTFTHTGHIIIYRQLIAKTRNDKPQWKRLMFKTGNLSKFGALRDLIRHIRNWHGKYFFMEVEDVSRTGPTEVNYLGADDFE